MNSANRPSVRLPVLLLALASLLSACGNAPEQPSEGPQRQAEPIGGEAEAAAADTAEDEPVLPELSEPIDVTAAPAEVFGSWAADAGACGAEAPVTISSSSYRDLAASCDINEIVDNGDGFTASMTCDRGGTSQAELLKLTPDGDTLTLDWVAQDEPKTVLVRCE